SGSLLYFFVDVRMYMPLLLLLVPLAALPMEWAIQRFRTNKQWGALVCILPLFCMSILGYPSKAGYPPVNGRLHLIDAIDYCVTHGFPANYRAAMQFKKMRLSPGIVLSDISPVYLNALLPQEFAAAPIDERHSYTFSAFWHYGREDALRHCRAELKAGHNAYALEANPTKAEETLARLPTVEGFVWERLKIRSDQAFAWKLTQK